MFHSAAVTLCFAVLLACAVVLVESVTSCDSRNACFPWNTGAGPSCSRGANLNLRFFMNTTDEYPEANRTMTFAFCPRVDELQAFNLSSAPRYSAIARNTSTIEFAENFTDTYVSVFGFGNYDSRLQPGNDSLGTALIIHNETDVPTCKANEVLFADFLVLQISLTGGMLTYPDAFVTDSDIINTTTNETSAPYVSSVPPQGSGFMSTCSDGVCSLDGSLKCIGPKTNQNCARCVTAEDLYNRTVQVWVSYYGTDSSSRRLLSGSSNPLNFRKWSGGSVYKSLSNSMNKVTSGEALDPGANPTF